MTETAIILLMLIFFILGHITGRRWEQFKQEERYENDRAIQDAMRLQSKRGYPTEETEGNSR
jgi:hypothetical protein